MLGSWSGWRMAGLVQLPVNGSWIMWEHSRDGWADFPVVISMYELIDSLAGATHAGRAGEVWGQCCTRRSLSSGSKQHGKYFLPSFVKMFQPSNKFPEDLELVGWHDAGIFIAFPPRLAKMTKGLLAKPRYSFSAHMSGICQFSTVNVTRPCP